MSAKRFSRRSSRVTFDTARQKVLEARQATVSGRYREAIDLTQAGLALLDDFSPSPEQSRIRFDLLLERGRARRLIGDYASLADFQAVRNESTDPAQRAAALVGIGECYSGTGDYIAAENAFHLALEEGEAGGLALCLIRSWSGLGTLYWKQGRIEEAVQALLKARVALQKTPDVYELGHVLVSLGIAHNYAGRLDRAMAAYEEALSCFRTLGDEHRVAAVLNNLGEVYQELGDVEQALTYHQEAVGIASRAGARRMEIDITRNVGVDLLMMGRYNEAMANLHQALAWARELGDKDLILQALYSLGDALLRQGDAGRALEVAGELAAEAQAVRSGLHAARARYLQGRAHLSRGDRAAAQATLQTALADAHAVTSRVLLWQLHAALGRATDDLNLAQVHFRIAADFIHQTVEPLTDPRLRARFLEQLEVRAVLERAEPG